MLCKCYVLFCAVLLCVVLLCCAVMCCAVMCCVVMCCAVMCCYVLCCYVVLLCCVVEKNGMSLGRIQLVLSAFCCQKPMTVAFSTKTTSG